MTNTHGTPGPPPVAGARAEPPAQSWRPAFVLLALIWGCSFAFVRVSLGALTPVQVASWRLLLGAATLLGIAALTRTRLPRDATTWRHLVVVAALLNAVPFTLFATGQQSVSSVFAAIVNAVTPLATLLVVLVAFPEEKPTPERVAGLLAGFLGILVVLGVWRDLGAGQWQGALACLAGVACYGVAFPYARRHLSNTPEGPVALAAGQVSVAAGLMLPVLLLTGVRPEHRPTPGVLAAMLALGALGSGVAYVLNFRIIARAGATVASSVTYLTPLVGAAVGAALLGEDVTWNQPVGALVVLAGVALAQGRLRLPRHKHGHAPPPAASTQEIRSA